jgi:ArsR family transcriptional regulator
MSDASNPPLIQDAMIERVARRLKVMGDPVRLELLNLLRIHEELSVQALVDASGQRQANVSKHLGIMMRDGLVKRRKEGVNAYYSIDDPSVPGVCLLIANAIGETETPAE